jgi:hypothetical protein
MWAAMCAAALLGATGCDGVHRGDRPPGDLAISVGATPPSACLGECVDLFAQASGGRPPYSYAWPSGIAAAGPHAEVCPLGTTAYTVAVRDGQGGTAQTTVTVALPPECATRRDAGGADVPDATLPDATLVGDAGAESGADGMEPDEAPLQRELCRREWPQPPGVTVLAAPLAADRDDGVYLAIQHDGGLDLGLDGGTLAARGTVVVKIDAACNVIWARELGPVTVAAIDTDLASDLTVLGTFEGTVDLGTGPLSSPAPTATDGFLMRLDPGGRPVFAVPFVTEQQGMTLHGLAARHEAIAVAATVPVDTDFGAGQDGDALASGDAQRSYLVVFDGTGAVVRQTAASTLDPSMNEVTDVLTDKVAGSLWALLAGPPSRAALVTLNPSGSVAVESSLSTDPPPIAAAGSLAVLVWSRYGTSSRTQVMQSYDSTGIAPWLAVSNTLMLPVADPDTTAAVAMDPLGRVASAGVFTGSLWLVDAGAPVISAGGSDLELDVFDDAGVLLTIGRWGGPEDEHFGGLGVDGEGNVWLSGTTTAAGDAGGLERVFVAKMAR